MQINAADLEWTESENEETTFRRKRLSKSLDGEKLGCSLYELPAGERSWPYHYHTANEEALFVLDGTGQIRTPDGTTPLESGDYLQFPADEDGAHRVINDSDGLLRYLAISTMEEPDVTVYPDKEMFGVYCGSPPGSDDERTFEGYYPIDAETDYWE